MGQDFCSSSTAANMKIKMTENSLMNYCKNALSFCNNGSKNDRHIICLSYGDLHKKRLSKYGNMNCRVFHQSKAQQKNNKNQAYKNYMPNFKNNYFALITYITLRNI
jgi:hypothetical protein